MVYVITLIGYMISRDESDCQVINFCDRRMMDVELTTLASASLPPVLSADNSSSSLDVKEPAINGIPHKHQLSDEQVDSSTMKTCDSSAENAEILTFKEDSVRSITPNKKSVLEEGQTLASDEELVPTEITIKKGSENSKGGRENAREIEIEENCKASFASSNHLSIALTWKLCHNILLHIKVFFIFTY